MPPEHTTSPQTRDDDTITLPTTTTPKHNPTGTKWEIRNERAAVNLQKTTRVIPVGTLSNTTLEDSAEETRITTRGRPWAVSSPTRSAGGVLKLAGESGHIRITVEEDDVIDGLEEIAAEHNADDSADQPLLITNLLRTPNWPTNEFVLDSQSEFVAFEADQRRSLLSLCMVDGWPRVYDKRDANADTVKKRLKSRAERIHDDLRTEYGESISVTVRSRNHDVVEQQYQIVVSFTQLLLPQDIAYVYRIFDKHDGINYAADSRTGTYFEGLRYRVCDHI